MQETEQVEGAPSSETSQEDDRPQGSSPATPPGPNRYPHSPPVPWSRAEKQRRNREPVLQMQTRTPIPEGLDAPGAGSRNVDAWLRRTFNMTLEEATRQTGHNTLRQIVWQLDAIAAGEGGYADDGQPSSPLPGTPMTVEQAESLPPAEDGPAVLADGEAEAHPETPAEAQSEQRPS